MTAAVRIIFFIVLDIVLKFKIAQRYAILRKHQQISYDMVPPSLFKDTTSTPKSPGYPAVFALYRNGSKFRNSLPLRIAYFRRPLATGLLCSIASAIPFHNGTKFRNSLPLRIAYFCLPLATGLLCSIASAIPFHNGTIFRDLLPLRNVLFCHTPSEGVVFHCISLTPSKGVTAMKTIQNT